MPTEPHCKGTVLTLARTFIGERLGKGAWEEILASVSPEGAAMLGGLVSIGWYPEMAFVRVLHAIHARGPGLVKDLATFEASQDLTVIHRVFLSLANPAYVLEKAGSYWRRFHDTGEWEVQRTTPRSATGSLRGWGIVDALACAYLDAYVARMFELVGARNLTHRHSRCRAHGADVCVFEGAWS